VVHLGFVADSLEEDNLVVEDSSPGEGNPVADNLVEEDSSPGEGNPAADILVEGNPEEDSSLEEDNPAADIPVVLGFVVVAQHNHRRKA